jgi:hypothetical protein
LVTYDYSKFVGLEYFPWRWTLEVLDDGKRTPVTEVQILSIELGGERQNRDAFSPKHIPQLATVANRVVLTNKEMYREVSNGVNVKLEPVQRGKPLSGSSRPLGQVGYRGISIVRTLLLVVVMVPLLCFFFRKVVNTK